MNLADQITAETLLQGPLSDDMTQAAARCAAPAGNQSAENFFVADMMRGAWNDHAVTVADKDGGLGWMEGKPKNERSRLEACVPR